MLDQGGGGEGAAFKKGKGGGSPVLCEGLVVDLDGLLQPVKLDQGVSLAREGLANELVVQAQLTAALHGLVAVLHARLVVAHLEVHRCPAGSILSGEL